MSSYALLRQPVAGRANDIHCRWYPMMPMEWRPPDFREQPGGRGRRRDEAAAGSDRGLAFRWSRLTFAKD